MHMNNRDSLLKVSFDALVAVASHPAVKIGVVTLMAVEQAASVLRQAQASQLHQQSSDRR